MNKQIEELKSYIPHAETLNKAISLATVGWHIHHSLGAINWAGLSLMRSKPADFKPSFNLKRAYVFFTGKFPRGKAKAPKNSVETKVLTLDQIEKELANALRVLEKVDKLPANSFMKHPIFQELNRKQAKRFLHIHTEHHLKIIRDILK